MKRSFQALAAGLLTSTIVSPATAQTKTTSVLGGYDRAKFECVLHAIGIDPIPALDPTPSKIDLARGIFQAQSSMLGPVEGIWTESIPPGHKDVAFFLIVTKSNSPEKEIHVTLDPPNDFAYIFDTTDSKESWARASLTNEKIHKESGPQAKKDAKLVKQVRACAKPGGPVS